MNFWSYCRFLGKLGVLLAKLYFLGWVGVLVGNAGADNTFIQCEQITPGVSVMGYTHTVSWEKAGKLEGKRTMTNNAAILVD